MEEKMTAEINGKIAKAVKEYEQTHQFNIAANTDIISMIGRLEQAVGKKYFYDEKGIHEKYAEHTD